MYFLVGQSVSQTKHRAKIQVSAYTLTYSEHYDDDEVP